MAPANPYFLEGPAMISFSGGRTSAYMLRRILDAHQDVLPPDVHVLFANTGKERPETLDFVYEVERRWCVRVRWIEYRNHEWNQPELEGEIPPGSTWEEVNYATASRVGEPYEAITRKRQYLPNPITRFCTEELKIRPMKHFMQAQGYDNWLNVVGMRADEPRRVARIRASNESGKEPWEVVMPLAEAGVTVQTVTAFWNEQPFDLQLRPWEGNCDLCFLKGQKKKLRIIRERPDLAAWWIAREEEARGTVQTGSFFRKDQPSYRQMLDMVMAQPLLPGILGENEAADDLLDCYCTGE